MRHRWWLVFAVLALVSEPAWVMAQEEFESVYAPPAPPREDEGVNEGAVNIDLHVRYMTDYVYRGIDRSEIAGEEDSPNVQFDGRLTFDLGKLPHPFIGLFANVYDSDPVTRFQEFRPFVGMDLTIRPLVLSAGHTSYIYPEREEINTSEVWGKIALDDSSFFETDRPLLAPYVMAAYDYDINQGWYVEAGVKHETVLEDIGVTLTFIADVGYIHGLQQQFVFVNSEDRGLQHYDVGVVGAYSLNTLFNVPRRFGEWTLEGYLFYTDGIDDELSADTQLWGGVGIGFRY